MIFLLLLYYLTEKALLTIKRKKAEQALVEDCSGLFEDIVTEFDNMNNLLKASETKYAELKARILMCEGYELADSLIEVKHM